MRTLRLFLTSLFAGGLLLVNVMAQPSAVDSILIDPIYPVVDQPITIYINANYYGLSTDNDQLSAWTGLITSASTDLKDNWRHNPISDWFDESIVLERVADVDNDSVFQLTITDISDFYGVNTSDETVFRIAFIARGHSGTGLSGQTSNIYFEVFGSEPSAVATSYPSNPTQNERIALDFNINAASNSSLATFIEANPGEGVYAHIGVSTNNGGWQHVIAGWGVNVPKNTLMTISDTVYRLYIDPNSREYFGLTAGEWTEGINLVLRNAGGTAQTEDLYVPVSGLPIDPAIVSTYAIYPEYPTVDDEIFIFINGNNWDFTEGNTLSAWTGLITSASANVGDDWRHNPISDWNNLTVELENVNDSVRVFLIESIADLYGVDTDDEEVFRIAFIARDSANGAVDGQTENLYFEIYGGVPESLAGVQPAEIDAYKAAVFSVNILADGGIDAYSDTLYAHTGVLVNGSTEWSHVVAQWSENLPKNRLMQINDSIYRFYIFPKVRPFYGVTATEVIDSIAIIFRNEAGNAQSSTLFIPVSDTTTIPSAINDVKANSLVSVYPNPATELVNIDLSNTKATMVNLYSANGQLVYSENVSGKQNLSVNVSTLVSNSGMLIYQVITETGTIQGQLLVK